MNYYSRIILPKGCIYFYLYCSHRTYANRMSCRTWSGIYPISFYSLEFQHIQIPHHVRD